MTAATTPEGPPVRVEQDGPVARVILDQPERRNVLSTAMVDALADALQQLRTQPGVRVVVLGHRGPAFCAGADLRSGGLAGLRSRVDLPGLLQMVQGLPQPVLAEVDGACLGGGMGLVAAADLVVASTRASFGFSEVRVGVAPAVVAVAALPKLGLAQARRWFLTGERFGADQAAAMGLVCEVAEPDDLPGTRDRLVHALLQGAPGAQAATKRVLATLPELPPEAAYAWAQQLSRQLFEGEEGQEGMAAFLERRSPRWVP
jgi:enoyl-CoA hydratase/carnithine racemase